MTVAFDPQAPWTITAEGSPDPADIALEIYGVEAPAALGKPDMFRIVEDLFPQAADRYVVVPGMLRTHYADEFHQLMTAALERDIKSVKSILFETRIDSDDEASLISHVEWWSRRKDLTDRSGRSYFDVFLARLKADSWYRDYGFWEGSSTPYLDSLYTEVEERAGELNTLIAQNSVEFGAYQPLWAALDERGVRANRPVPDADLVARSAALVLDRLEGRTSESDSGTIADVLVGLPPREKAAVLRKIMSRYDEREYLIFGRFGEAWEGGMLFWLFEDLDDEDRIRVADSIKASGVMQPEAVDALLAGRGLGGEYLPWTTYHGQQAAQYWADLYNESEGASAVGAAIAGGFASLWTPDTAGATVLTFVTAGTASGIAAAAPKLGQGMLVVGTGVTSYQTTVAAGELISGEDAYSGEKLDQTDKIVRILHVVSGVLMLSAGAMSARAMTAGAKGTTPDLTEPTPPAIEEGSVQWRIVGSDPTTGEVIAIGQSLETAQSAVIRLNPQTGLGSATNLSTGAVQSIRAFQLEARAAGALSGGAPAAESTALAIAGPLPPQGTGPSAIRPPIPTGTSPLQPSPPRALEVTDMFAEAQGMVTPEALADQALADGLISQPIPEAFYYDEVSGDFLPWYLNAETGSITPHWLSSAKLGTIMEAIASFGYPINQLPLRTRLSGQPGAPRRGQIVRLDSYDPDKGEIVSRKRTQLGAIDEWDALNHVQELVTKYPSGAL
ncbi:MAG: hypothetical protein M3400_15520, partial [Actinomycetota bacterium]|nr:hypothetical protein [Actinomycetota bacterium]